jgi:hypothetical protein
VGGDPGGLVVEEDVVGGHGSKPDLGARAGAQS